MTLHLEPLATPFDAPQDPITIATPSCCCCCCCCLVTLTTAATLAGAEASFHAKEHNRSRWAAGLAGVAAVPLAVAAAFVVAPDDGTAFVVIPLLFVIVMASAMKLGGATTESAIIVAVITGVAATGAFLVEVGAALVTFFIIELLAPFGIWAGYAIARGRHDRRTHRVRAEQTDLGHLRPPASWERPPPPAPGSAMDPSPPPPGSEPPQQDDGSP